MAERGRGLHHHRRRAHAFNRLGTDEEREQFVEQFWLRRDPTPDTAENEYREEHYRRIAFANEHFASGVPGWKTDRGRMYIRFGPPDEIEPHPSGGTYQRTAQEGGGTSSSFPFERWRYRYLENVGENVELEFVDTTMSGEYHLSHDPCEKDALNRVPGAAPTDAERLGMSTQAARFQNTNGTTCGPALGGIPFDQFGNLEKLANIEKAPPVKLQDLERELVNTRISFNSLPMLVQVDYLRVTAFSVIANVTIQFENRDLSFQSREGVQKSLVDVMGRVSTMTHRPVVTFETPLQVEAPAGMLQSYSQMKSVYQKSLPLTPGRYRLDIVAKDTVSGNMNRYELALDVPRYEPEKLATSSLILADRMEKLPLKKASGEMFAIGDFKVRPRVSGQFSRDEKLGMYLQIYNLIGGASPRKPRGNIRYEISRSGSDEPLLQQVEELANISDASVDQVTVGRMVPLNSLSPGNYTLKLKVSDGDRTLQRQAQFSVR
ncbi:MAG TPA: GWxTD domain-containing protein [Bryobacteraceae bacterium]|jgi:GWxTD domain-containing protein